MSDPRVLDIGDDGGKWLVQTTDKDRAFVAVVKHLHEQLMPDCEHEFAGEVDELIRVLPEAHVYDGVTNGGVYIGVDEQLRLTAGGPRGDAGMLCWLGAQMAIGFAVPWEEPPSPEQVEAACEAEYNAEMEALEDKPWSWKVLCERNPDLADARRGIMRVRLMAAQAVTS